MQKQRKVAGSFPEMECAGISLKHSTASALPLLAPAGFPGIPGVLGHLTAIIGGVLLLLTPPATSHPIPRASGWPLSGHGVWPQLPRQTHVPPEAQKMPRTSSECVVPHDPCLLPVSRSWVLGWHETWLGTRLPFLPFREPEAAR